MDSAERALPADAARAQIRADLELIDAAYVRMRATCTDLVGNAFRVEMAERLETLDRINRGLSHRVFGEIADPVDGPDDPALPADVSMRRVLCSRLRITSAEVKRRFRVAVRIRPRRSLTGPVLPPELPQLATAIEAGNVGDDHIAAILHAVGGAFAVPVVAVVDVLILGSRCSDVEATILLPFLAVGGCGRFRGRSYARSRAG